MEEWDSLKLRESFQIIEDKNNSKFKFYMVLSDILNKEIFYDKIKSKFSPSVDYFTHVKICFNSNGGYHYKMLGSQIIFSYRNNLDLNEFFSLLQIRLIECLNEYQNAGLSIDSVFWIELSSYTVNKNLLLKYKSEVNPLPNYNNTKYLYKDITKLLEIPLDTNRDLNPLSIETNNGLISKINYNINNNNINFLELILSKNKNFNDKFPKLNQNWEFHIVKSHYKYILGIYKDDSSEIKIKFNLNGNIISCVKDVLLKNGYFSRISDNTSYLLSQNKDIIKINKNLLLKPLPSSKAKDTLFSNPKIGGLDTETFINKDGISKIYSLGFKTADSEKLFYIDKDSLSSDDIVIQLIFELLRPKYKGFIFYCHNFSGYDTIFIIDSINKYNLSKDKIEDKIILTPIFRDNKIIQLSIKFGKNKIMIRDSYLLLNSSLEKLAINLKVDTLKSKFPYNFARENNLFYIGETPDIKHYNNISREEYSNLYRKDWSFKNETLKYLSNDINCLYEILIKANKQFNMDYGLNITDKITISSTALNLFLSKYYKRNIPLINKQSIYNDIKSAYYGGITEVYRGYGENLYYYDVNSLYPFVALENPTPGLDCHYTEYFNTTTNINNLFGFFYCEIETPLDDYIGLLPIKTPSGMQLPLGKFKGWYFSELLKFAQSNGYKIKVIKGYNFSREKDVFKEYITDIYEKKLDSSNPVRKALAKSLLNNLIGRFGINIDKNITQIVNYDKFQLINSIFDVNSCEELDRDNYLITFKPVLKITNIDYFNLDILKILKDFSDNETSSQGSITSVVIPAAVNAYAHIHMHKIKLYILNKGGKIYYSDTDSIVTDIKLPDLDPSEIGKLKLEHVISKGYFISNKLYAFYDINNKLHIKGKGVDSKSLDWDNFISLYKNTSVKGMKKSSTTDWKTGSVSINETLISLSGNSFQKRIKIHDSTNNWCDTKPFIINNLDKDLIIHPSKY